MGWLYFRTERDPNLSGDRHLEIVPMLRESIFALMLTMGWPVLSAQAQTPPRVAVEAMRQAQTLGAVRVVAMLRDPDDGTAAGTRARAKAVAVRAPAAERERRIRAQSDQVLAALPPQTRVLRRFARVPALALDADAATLAALARHPRVLRVDIDTGGEGAAVTPDAASVLNQVHQLPALGLGGAGMKVAVIDSGIDTDHADFNGRIVGQQCFCGGVTGCCPNGTATQSGAGAAEDNHGHGTNVAGIIGGDGDLAPRGALPAVQLVAVKVLDSANRFCCTSDVIAALDWVATNHPDVDAVNLSLGTSALYAGDCDNASATNQALAAAVANLNAAGAVVTASAGNQANYAQSSAPACIANVMGTGATWDFSGGAISFLGCSELSTAPRQPACFSNRSATTDLFAAGALVTAPGFNGATSTFGGTSQAAPMVAACAVALKQAAPASTVAQRMQAMTLSPTRLQDTASGREYPFLDCRDAIKLLNPAMFDPIPVEGRAPKQRPRTAAAASGSAASGSTAPGSAAPGSAISGSKNLDPVTSGTTAADTY